MDTHKNSELKIVLTGGHAATPGIAVAEELKKRYPEAALFWIGSKYAVPGTKVTTLEYKIFPELGVKFYPLIEGKLQTKFTPYTIPLLLSIPLSFIQAMWYILKIRPKVIVSFGGFSSFSVIFCGWLLRIPVILHEQTVAAGRAGIMSSRFASQIALARSESLSFFPKSKSVVTGNPLMKEVLAISPKQKLGKIKRILVMGGSRGSEFINEEIFKIVKDLLKKYQVTHVTGERDFHIYKSVNLPGYKALAYVDPIVKRPQLFEDADLIVSRSGANTVSEVMHIKRPSLLIPLPRTYMDEQYKNAKFAEEFGIAKVMRETEITPVSLLKSIDDMFLGWEKMVADVLVKQSPDIGATQKIADIVAKYL
jgi:UDP-N-acetylglucosamine--N-acetylmuramyl-(pentapeptide) pyrophosphoryl-undecaprenol N-acetylglucosamine transferase